MKKFFFLTIFLTLNYFLKSQIIFGNSQFENYLPFLQNKKVALVVNHTAKINDKHLVDVLCEKGISIIKIFAPEHGFRGNSDRGQNIPDSIDEKSKIPIVSLYGKNHKPSAAQLQNVDVVLFDIQDVGVRFFTYISTMHYVMEACAENRKKLIILDRPNPLGDYVDGPVLKNEFRSFVGMHPIPIVHGLTIGELAKMINGEKWLKNKVQCDLEVVKMKNYSHKTQFFPDIKPSPNLVNAVSIRLYPSLCLFEGTNVSVGRGTEFPFQIIGFPDKKFGDFSFTPVSKKNMESKPLHQNKICYGIDLRDAALDSKFSLKYFLEFYRKSGWKEKFFAQKEFFNKLAGNSDLQKQIIEGKSESEIKESWKKDIEKYKILRKKYLLYEDFE